MNLPEEVIKAVEEARCVLFVGSRASVEAAELAGVSAQSEKKLGKDICGKRVLLPEACARREDADGRPAMLDALKAHRGFEDIDPSIFHTLAVKRFPRIFTTCWDTLLERAAADLGGAADVAYPGQDVPEHDLGRRAVVKLWGGLERPDTVRVTVADLGERPGAAAFRKQLRVILRDHVVFFVGFGPQESDFDLVWDELSNAYGGELPRCHMAVPQGKLSDALWQKWVWRGILPFTADPAEALEALEAKLA